VVNEGKIWHPPKVGREGQKEHGSGLARFNIVRAGVDSTISVVKALEMRTTEGV